MADVGDGDLATVEVLERDVDRRQRGLEHVRRLRHHARLVGVEREALAADELLLELVLGLPAAVLDREADVGGVRTGRVREDARRRLAHAHAELLGLLLGVLADIILVVGLVRFRGELHGAVQQVHLVDEEVAEDARAGHDHVDARPSQLLERDELELVDTAEASGTGLTPTKPRTWASDSP